MPKERFIKVAKKTPKKVASKKPNGTIGAKPPTDKFERHSCGAVSMTAEQSSLNNDEEKLKPVPYAHMKDAVHVIDPNEPLK